MRPRAQAYSPSLPPLPSRTPPGPRTASGALADPPEVKRPRQRTPPLPHQLRHALPQGEIAADPASPARPPGLVAPPGLPGPGNGGSQPESIPGTPLSAVSELGGEAPKGSPPRLAGTANQASPLDGQGAPCREGDLSELHDLTEPEIQFIPSQREGRANSPRARPGGSADPDPEDTAATPKSGSRPTSKAPGEAEPAAEGTPLGEDEAAANATDTGEAGRPAAPSEPASSREGTPTPDGHTPGHEAALMDGLDCDPTWESVRQDVSRLCQLAVEPYLLYMGFQEYPPHQGLVLPATTAIRWCGVAATLGSLATALVIWISGMDQPRDEGGGARVPQGQPDPPTCPPERDREPPIYSRPPYSAEIYEVALSGYWDHVLVATAVGIVAGLVAHWIYTTRPTMRYGPIHRSDRPPPNPKMEGASPAGGPGLRTDWEWKPEHGWVPPPGPHGSIQEWTMGPQGGLHSSPRPTRDHDTHRPPTPFPGLSNG